MANKFVDNVPENLQKKLSKYMESCGYSKGTIDMRIGNLGYLFGVFPNELLNLLEANKGSVNDSLEYVIKNLPHGGLQTADI